MRRSLFFIAVLLATLTTTVHAQTTEAAVVAAPDAATTFRTYAGLEYERPNGFPMLMDLRVPDGAGPWPVILSLHSGAWISGDRTVSPGFGQATRGYAVVSIDYRLAPYSVWPAQIEDAKAAVRWLRANAARFHLDPERVGVYGTSAGAHIGSVLGTSGGVAELEGLKLGNPTFSSRVKAVVELYGPTDLLRLDADKIDCIPLDGNAVWMPPSLLMGCAVQSCKEKTITASPMTYITPDDPPFLLMQGMADCLVSYKQAIQFHDALRAKNVKSTLVLLPTASHADDQFNDAPYQAQIDAFLDANLKGAVQSAPIPSKRRAAGH